MLSPDHPELQFIQAKHYYSGRPDGHPLWIVIHDMEASENSTRAETTAAYFANPGDGRVVSAHYCTDNDSIVQCVRLGHTAFTAGSREGNYRGINWELAGFASQTRTQWLDEYGRAMFAKILPIMRHDAQRFGIPLVRRTVTELKAFVRGITSHNDLRLAFGGTTHTDPGGNFPWDYFMQELREETTMTDPFQNTSRYANADGIVRTQDQKLHDLSDAIGPGKHPNSIPDKLNEILDRLATPIAATVDYDRIRAIVREEIDADQVG